MNISTVLKKRLSGEHLVRPHQLRNLHFATELQPCLWFDVCSKRTTHKVCMHSIWHAIFAHTQIRTHGWYIVACIRKLADAFDCEWRDSADFNQDSTAHVDVINTNSGVLLASCEQHVQKQIRVIHQYSQMSLPWHLRIILLVLFITASSYSCNGLCSSTNLRYRHILSCYYIPRTLTQTLSSFVESIPRSLELWPSYPPLHQRSHRDLECSSKVPWTHASNCRQKANVLRVRTDQSGLGTYHVSPTWAACSLMLNCSTATSRGGTCRR